MTDYEHFVTKAEVRIEQRSIIALLVSDLYKRVPTEGNPKTDADWLSPLGWRVRLERPDLAGGVMRIDVHIIDPFGKSFADIQGATADEIHAVLP